MRGTVGRQAPLWAAVVSFLVVTAVVAGVLHLRDGSTAGGAALDAPRVSVQVVQLRRDEVIGRVELAVSNDGTGAVVIDRLRLRSGGFTGGGWVPKSSPVPAGQVVDLPTPYGDARCPSQGQPRLGRVSVDLRLHAADDPRPRSVTLTPTRSRVLLTRILRSLCVTERLTSEVALSFGPRWSAEGTGDAASLHTTLEAVLTPGSPPRDVTQVSGSVIYAMAAETSATPFARLDAAHPRASIPVVVRAARCTAHAKGETKQPYKFLVWLGPPGTPGQAVELPVSAADQERLRAVCPL
ncbi:MAG: hypothetical protein ACXV3C_02420 [Actinomycetes bacterium]